MLRTQTFQAILVAITILYTSDALTEPLLLTEFCKGLPTGQFCNVRSPRQIVQCPSSTSTTCPVNYACKENPISTTNQTYTASW
jgi:hypothetical protein